VAFKYFILLNYFLELTIPRIPPIKTRRFNPRNPIIMERIPNFPDFLDELFNWNIFIANIPKNKNKIPITKNKLPKKIQIPESLIEYTITIAIEPKIKKNPVINHITPPIKIKVGLISFPIFIS